MAGSASVKIEIPAKELCCGSCQAVSYSSRRPMFIVSLRLTFQSSPIYNPKKSETVIGRGTADHLRSAVQRAQQEGRERIARFSQIGVVESIRGKRLIEVEIIGVADIRWARHCAGIRNPSFR